MFKVVWLMIGVCSFSVHQPKGSLLTVLIETLSELGVQSGFMFIIIKFGRGLQRPPGRKMPASDTNAFSSKLSGFRIFSTPCQTIRVDTVVKSSLLLIQSDLLLDGGAPSFSFSMSSTFQFSKTIYNFLFV